MPLSITEFAIHSDEDAAFARQRVREVAALAGLSEEDQTCLATAASELARDCYLHAQHGRVQARVDKRDGAQFLRIIIADREPDDGLREGKPEPKQSIGNPWSGRVAAARRLVDDFAVESDDSGTRATLTVGLPAHTGRVTGRRVAEWVKALERSERGTPLDELQQQSQELTAAFIELNRAREEADTASRAKSDFLARVSHELRTPLNAIAGFAVLMHKNKAGNLNDKDLHRVQRIRENCEHLLGLINDILDLSKIEAGRLEIVTEATNLDVLIRETADQLGGEAKFRKVRLKREVPRSLALLETDESRLKQVLINLLSNALKFTAEGSVTIRVEADPKTRQPVRIDVIDTGIGISSDKLEEIFEAFRQADRQTSYQYGGTGLGLAISRSLCQLMGYDLTVESEEGKGSTFSIHLGGEPKTQD